MDRFITDDNIGFLKQQYFFSFKRVLLSLNLMYKENWSRKSEKLENLLSLKSLNIPNNSNLIKG